MKIFKFGGASLKDAENIKKVCEIIKRETYRPLIVVVSAFYNITNLLEKLWTFYINEEENYVYNQLEKIKKIHIEIVKCLGLKIKKVEKIFFELEECLKEDVSLDYNYEYDKIVSFGELLSSTIVSDYLNKLGIKVTFVDIRDCLITDSNYKEANVDIETSKHFIKKKFNRKKLYITQGFIGSTMNKLTTTLGREGSDYTAALLGNILSAKSVTIWKDVPGVLTADPKIMKNYTLIEEMSYDEAIELAYYGAQIIHPKTIKPLQNKSIPLFVKYYEKPDHKGTVIHNTNQNLKYKPIYIFKFNQCLLSIKTKDFSFIAEENLKLIFNTLSDFKIKTNLLQQTAIAVFLCVDYDEKKIFAAYNYLKKFFDIKIETNLTLLTIRHYTLKALAEQINSKKIIIEDINRNTAKLVYVNE